MSAFREIVKVIQRSPILSKAIPATSPVKAVFVKGVHRTSLYALAAFLTGFEQTGFFGIYQRMVSQFGLAHETSQSTRATNGCNQQMINPKPPQVHQMSQMFMGPACHQLGLIKVVGGWSQPGFVTVIRQKITQGPAQSPDQIIGLNIGDSPFAAASVLGNTSSSL